MKQRRAIELLAPAKNAETGIEAILHGADAVYIGAPRYGARAAAGCTTSDIERLCNFAHTYNARVYVALNTILYNDELEDARRIIYELYHAGVDALIVQDMALLQLDLPPIALHASTQCDNRTAEKVQFLADAGFSQVVLARELSLDDIRNIAQHTQVPLEVFVHGALCVSYSGQCYLSAALNNRSANRGECAQCCRLSYSLIDGNGKCIADNKHLLSLKDLNQSSRLEELIDAGASSFKIEGRLKDISYVKNITAYYRQQLDQIIARRSDELYRASNGVSTINFTPNPNKSFNRGFTHYFLDGRSKEAIIQPHSPKSMGEYVGKIQAVINNRTFRYNGNIELHNGDGLCYIDNDGNFHGFRVNRAEGKIIHTATAQNITRGATIYRNSDQMFDTALQRPTAQRHIEVEMTLGEQPEGFALTISDGTTQITHRCNAEKSLSRTPQAQRQVQELSKLGNTPYRAARVNIDLQHDYFIQPSLLSTWRREAIEWFDRARRLAYRTDRRKHPVGQPQWHTASVDYRANIANHLAKKFYQNHGVETTAPAFELSHPDNSELMRTRHCIRHYLGACLKTPQGKNLVAPLTLRHGNVDLQLHFDCARCEMVIKK